MNPLYQHLKHKWEILSRKVILGLNLVILRHRHLTRRDVRTLALWVSIIPVCCAHQLFSRTKIVDAFLTISYPLEHWWYVYFLSRSIAWILVSMAIVRMCNRALRPFGKLFLSYNIYGLLMFFINCNSVNYYYAPLIIIAIICNKIYS